MLRDAPALRRARLTVIDQYHFTLSKLTLGEHTAAVAARKCVNDQAFELGYRIGKLLLLACECVRAASEQGERGGCTWH